MRSGFEKWREEESYERWQQRLIVTQVLIELFEEELRKFAEDKDFKEYHEEAREGLRAIQVIKKVLDGFIPP